MSIAVVGVRRPVSTRVRSASAAATTSLSAIEAREAEPLIRERYVDPVQNLLRPVE